LGSCGAEGRKTGTCWEDWDAFEAGLGMASNLSGTAIGTEACCARMLQWYVGMFRGHRREFLEVVGGEFGHDQPDTRRDLFPLWGRCQGRGNTMVFEAGSSSTTGSTGSAYAYVVGEMRRMNGQLVLTANVATGSAMGAVVNGQKFLTKRFKTLSHHYRSTASPVGLSTAGPPDRRAGPGDGCDVEPGVQLDGSLRPLNAL
jgi:hypothetical protein